MGLPVIYLGYETTSLYLYLLPMRSGSSWRLTAATPDAFRVWCAQIVLASAQRVRPRSPLRRWAGCSVQTVRMSFAASKYYKGEQGLARSSRSDRKQCR